MNSSKQEDKLLQQHPVVVNAEFFYKFFHGHPLPFLAADIHHYPAVLHQNGSVAMLQSILHVVSNHESAEFRILSKPVCK